MDTQWKLLLKYVDQKVLNCLINISLSIAMIDDTANKNKWLVGIMSMYVVWLLWFVISTCVVMSINWIGHQLLYLHLHYLYLLGRIVTRCILMFCCHSSAPPLGSRQECFGRTYTSRISMTYLSTVSMTFLMMCRSVFLWALIPAHTMTEPCHNDHARQCISAQIASLAFSAL